MGMVDLLPHIHNIWMSERDDIDNVVERIKAALSESSKQNSNVTLSTEDFDTAFHHFSQTFDEEHGGFGISPKFPSPHNLLFLLRYWKRSGDDWALFMVEKTLSEIRKGGIFDQIGYGIHRYSTDAHWQLLNSGLDRFISGESKLKPNDLVHFCKLLIGTIWNENLDIVSNVSLK